MSKLNQGEDPKITLLRDELRIALDEFTAAAIAWGWERSEIHGAAKKQERVRFFKAKKEVQRLQEMLLSRYDKTLKK